MDVALPDNSTWPISIDYVNIIYVLFINQEMICKLQIYYNASAYGDLSHYKFVLGLFYDLCCHHTSFNLFDEVENNGIQMKSVSGLRLRWVI